MNDLKLLNRKILKMIEAREISPEAGIKIIKNQNRFLADRETPDSGTRDVAVIGISGRYPGAENLVQFWNNLKEGRDCITEIPRERWDWKSYYDPDPEKAFEGKIYNKWGGFINDADKFDPLFFNISPVEAESIDPQERLFLQTVWHTLEDSGYTRQKIKETVEGRSLSDVGVFVGETTNSYLLWGPEEWQKGNKVIPTSFPWSVANRVSYFFDWSGPSITVDTACASSLVAVHLACESIKRGECYMAIAGGVNLYLHPMKYIWLCRMTMLSRKGKCYTFGEEADGFQPGEGVGAVLLKPLDDAINDEDRIYGVIRGSAINHDGKTTGYTVPNPNAQSALICMALEKGEINPRSISYVEAHGTGTSLGDPIEVTGLTAAFRNYTHDTRFCALGSVKTNIGHLESSAGIAGLTKVLLQMKNQLLVPSLHSGKLNPIIDFASSPFHVQQTLEKWKRPVIQGKEFPRRGAISSFGAGGVNCHLIVEEYPQEKREITGESGLIVLSARNRESLKSSAINLLNHIESLKDDDFSMGDLAYTLSTGREEMEERLGLTASSKEELEQKLSNFLANGGDGFARGNTKKYKKELKALKEKEGAIIEHYLETEDYAALAVLWVKGLPLPWDKLYAKEQFHKIELPGYPFAREKIWFEVSREKKEAISPGGKDKFLVTLLKELERSSLDVNVVQRILEAFYEL